MAAKPPNAPDRREDIGIRLPEHELHVPIFEDIYLNRDKLELILGTVRRDRDRPKYSDAWPWIGVLLAFLLALIAGDFEETFGLSGDTWAAGLLFGSIASGVIILRIVFNGWRHRADHAPEPKKIIDDLIAEMGQTRGAIERAPHTPNAQPSATSEEYPEKAKDYPDC